MNYPKMLYRGDHYNDFMQMGHDIHSNKLEHRYVNNEEEEIQAVEDGFGPLANFIGQREVLGEDIIGTQSAPAIEKIRKPRGRPRVNHDPN